VSVALCHAALDEMKVAKAGRPKKKRELALACASEATAAGWLPPELRHPAAPDHSGARE
jgi:hypothetical protein